MALAIKSSRKHELVSLVFNHSWDTYLPVCSCGWNADAIFTNIQRAKDEFDLHKNQSRRWKRVRLNATSNP